MIRVILLLSIISFFFACKKKEVSWDTEWSVPIINDTLSLDYLVNDSTLSTSNGTYYELELSRTLTALSVNDILKIDSTSIKEVFAISTSVVNITPGFSFVNSAEEHELDLQDAEITKIILSKGKIDIRVENPISASVLFNVSLPGVTKDGATLQQQFTAPGGSTTNPGVVESTIDLSGYTIDLTGFFGDKYNVIRSQVTVTSLGTASMTNLDTTRFEANLYDVGIYYAMGYFGSKLLEINQDTTYASLDLYDSGIIDVPQISTSFEIRNGFKFGAQAMLNEITNTNSMNNSVSLTGGIVGANFHIDPATGAWSGLTPSVQSFSFTSGNSNIESFLENLGNKFHFDYQYQINPWGNTSGGTDELFPNSKIEAKLNVTMPLIPGMDKLVLKDTFDVDLSQSNPNVKVRSGQLFLNASNAFPISGAVQLYLLGENHNEIGVIMSDSYIESSKYGSFDPAHNLNVCKSDLTFTLPASILEQLDDIKYIAVRTEFSTPNPISGLNEPVAIPINAFLAIKVRTKFLTDNSF